MVCSDRERSRVRAPRPAREVFHQACFIARQSAERSVKAIGYGLGDRTIIGHSVVALAERFLALARTHVDED